MLLVASVTSCEKPTSPDYSNRFDERSDYYVPLPITDIDGNVYPTVKIGGQVWMASNLKVGRYQNGSEIPNVTDSNQWYGYNAGAWVTYSNQSLNNPTYGKLYNYNAVTDNRGICPIGWRVPSVDDWRTLFNSLGGFSIAGKKLKSTSGWNYNGGNGNGTNENGFNALPGGFRWANGPNDVVFTGIGSSGWWWADAQGSNISNKIVLRDYSESVSIDWRNYSSGLSVRCIKQ